MGWTYYCIVNFNDMKKRKENLQDNFLNNYNSSSGAFEGDIDLYIPTIIKMHQNALNHIIPPPSSIFLSQRTLLPWVPPLMVEKWLVWKTTHNPFKKPLWKIWKIDPFQEITSISKLKFLEKYMRFMGGLNG